MPLFPESRPRRHPLSSRPVTCKFPLRTQSTLSTGRGLQGRPTRHLCPCAGLRSSQAGHEPLAPQSRTGLSNRRSLREGEGAGDPSHLPSKSAAACR